MNIDISKARKEDLLGKLTTGVLLIGLSGLVSCTPQKVEPTLSEVVTSMELSKMDYTNSLNNAEKVMKKVIQNRNFTSDEQKEVYAYLSSAISNFTVYTTLSDKCPELVEPLVFPTNNFPWYNLLEKNVIGFDGGSPEIEKYFARTYSGFKADSIHSKKEKEAAETALEVTVEILSGLLGN